MNDSELAAALLDASPDGLMLVENDGTISRANPSAAAIFGREDLAGCSVDELVPEEHRPGHVRHRARYIAHPTIRPMGTGLRLFAQHADGTMFPVEISLSPVPIDGRMATIAAVRDVTDRQVAESHLALLRDRERIARDLHDMVIQRLFASGMSLQAVAKEAQSPIVAERIADTIDDLDATIRELRAAIFQLGGHERDRSVGSRLAELIADRRAQLGFDPDIHTSGAIDDLPEHVVDQLLATVSEAMSNVARHADASMVMIQIERRDDELELRIADDGQGLPAKPKEGGGLTNMMWRAAELGGTCSVGAADPVGTVVSWSVPI
jgi:PAS domain S-box-containing protein